MSVFIDRAFLLRVSPKLQKFTTKKPDLYNFRCPLCGDSTKNKTKARGYVYRKKNDYFYRCHNCGASTSFYNFLEKVDSSLVKEYALERYKNGEDGNQNYPKPEFEEVKEKPIFKKKLDLPSIADLPDEHYAKVYVHNRKIPESKYSNLYYAEDFKKFVESLNIEKDGLKDEDPRLVIPFYDEEKTLVAFQGRALGESKLRYITVKLSEDNHKIFGLDNINKEEYVYVVEGPIDSMFLENAIATADSNLTSAAKHIDKSKVVLVYDKTTESMVDTTEQVVTKGLKSNFIAQVKDTAGKLLNATDWYVIRKAERSIDIPSDIVLKRTQIITESNRLEVDIQASTTVEELITVLNNQNCS